MKLKIFLLVVILVIVALVLVATKNMQKNDVLSGVVTTATSTPVSQKIYSMAEIALHSSVISCWATVNGKVYDLTSWIKNHPGGQQAILSICGKDGTAAFTGQHGGQPNPESTLASFYIGELKK